MSYWWLVGVSVAWGLLFFYMWRGMCKDWNDSQH